MQILNSNEFVKFLFYCAVFYIAAMQPTIFGWLYTLWIFKI